MHSVHGEVNLGPLLIRWLNRLYLNSTAKTAQNFAANTQAHTDSRCVWDESGFNFGKHFEDFVFVLILDANAGVSNCHVQFFFIEVICQVNLDAAWKGKLQRIRYEIHQNLLETPTVDI